MTETTTDPAFKYYTDTQSGGYFAVPISYLEANPEFIKDAQTINKFITEISAPPPGVNLRELTLESYPDSFSQPKPSIGINSIDPNAPSSRTAAGTFDATYGLVPVEGGYATPETANQYPQTTENPAGVPSSTTTPTGTSITTPTGTTTTTPTGTTAPTGGGAVVPYSTITPGMLQGSAELAALDKKLDDLAGAISAGMASTSQTAILEGLFEKFGVQESLDLLNSYNQIIFGQQKILKELPEAIQRSLEDVGVSQSQLTRLVARESVKPMEALNEAMQLAGIAQDRINQSLQFVGMFADAAIADQAAKIEAMKFQFEYVQGKVSDLKEDQRFMLGLAIDERKGVLDVAAAAAGNGAPQSIITAIALAKSIPEALIAAGQYLNDNLQNEKTKIQTLATQAAENGAPSSIVQQIAQATTYDQALALAGSYVQAPTNPDVKQFGSNYYQWNPTTKTWDIIPGVSSTSGTTEKVNLSTQEYEVLGSDGKMHLYRDIINDNTGAVVSHTDLGLSTISPTGDTNPTTKEVNGITYQYDAATNTWKTASGLPTGSTSTTSSTAGSASMEDFKLIYGRYPTTAEEYNKFLAAQDKATTTTNLTAFEIQQQEIKDTATKLAGLRDSSGYVPINFYISLRSKSTLTPDEFDLRFGSYISKKDLTAINAEI